jgi:hypothetical protein
VFFEERPSRRSAAKLLTKDEARRIAVNIAKKQSSPTETVSPCSTSFEWAILPLYPYR